MEIVDKAQSLTGEQVPGPAGRLVIASVVLAAVGAAAGFAAGGAVASAGAAGGTLVAGLYAAAFLRSHLRERDRAFDRAIAVSTLARLSLVAIGGAAAWLMGRPAVVAYLLSFAIAFAALVGFEIPRITRQLRSRGLLGDSRT